MSRPRPSLLARPARPPWSLGAAAAVAAVVATTVVLFPLEELAPPLSLGVVYLVGVLVVSTFWGAGLGLLCGVASAAAFNFFHIPPTGHFSIARGEDWVALAVFGIAAVLASSVAEVARARAAEAERGRREADLAAELARLLLGTPEPAGALPAAGQRIAAALGLGAAALVLGAADGDERTLALPLDGSGGRLGTLLVPRAASREALTALRERVAPALQALLAAALERERLMREVVETSALRRSDDLKTALLRSVSHDLRSPLTAIVAGADALGSPALADTDRRELAEAVASESARLARLVDQLLDLSRLQAGVAEPRRDWCSLEEVLQAAVDDTSAPPGRVRLVVDRDLPLIRADAAQLERAFANLVENALRHGGEHPVSVRARATGGRMLVRVVDRGPGIPLAEQARIFEPFYRSPAPAPRAPGSGLGLAIVRGLVEANGGEVRVESLPGQGASFVVELPLPDRAPAAVPA